MIKIITAIGNPIIHKMISENNNIKIIERDIQYKDAIVEILEKNNSDIDFLIVDENLPGEMNKKEIIKKIKKINSNIQIIFINMKIEIEKNKNDSKSKKIKNENFEKNIVKIIEKKIGIIKNEEKNYIIDNNNYKEKKNRIQKKYSTYFEQLYKDIILKNRILKKMNKKDINKNNQTEIIAILGNNGVGKSIVLSNLAYFYSKQKKKILIIESKENNANIMTFFGLKHNKNILKINKRLYLEENITKDIFEKTIGKNFDIVMIEILEMMDENIKREIIKKCNKFIFIIEPNLIGIKNSKNIINNYEKFFKIQKEKIMILINKYNKFSINKRILKNIFYKYKIIGKIKYKNKYNLYINGRYKNIIFNKNIEREYKNIIKKIA